jgi:hypothetical protein
MPMYTCHMYNRCVAGLEGDGGEGRGGEEASGRALHERLRAMMTRHSSHFAIQPTHRGIQPEAPTRPPRGRRPRAGGAVQHAARGARGLARDDTRDLYIVYDQSARARARACVRRVLYRAARACLRARVRDAYPRR